MVQTANPARRVEQRRAFKIAKQHFPDDPLASLYTNSVSISGDEIQPGVQARNKETQEAMARLSKELANLNAGLVEARKTKDPTEMKEIRDQLTTFTKEVEARAKETEGRLKKQSKDVTKAMTKLARQNVELAKKMESLPPGAEETIRAVVAHQEQRDEAVFTITQTALNKMGEQLKQIEEQRAATTGESKKEKKLQQQLDPVVFLRVHRSALVNVNRIREIVVHANGEYRLTLVSGDLLKSSRRYKKEIRALMAAQ